MSDYKPILDMTAGSRMMWFDKDNPMAVFLDKRELETELCDGRQLIISPDVKGDWTDGLPFEDNTFKLVIFDPPHLLHAGKDSWLAKKYGTLDQDNWQQVISEGFSEAFRVLDDYGVLVFKWNDSQLSVSDILKETAYKPLFGQKRQKTHWLVFMKV